MIKQIEAHEAKHDMPLAPKDVEIKRHVFTSKGREELYVLEEAKNESGYKHVQLVFSTGGGNTPKKRWRVSHHLGIAGCYAFPEEAALDIAKKSARGV